MNAFRALMTGLIDYAGLFPPASLNMEQALRNYDSYTSGEHAWMLGRFIVPAARLGEFETAYANMGSVGTWRLSAIASADDAERVRAFNAKYASGGPRIDAIEVKVSTAAEIRTARQSYGPSMALFFEAPLADIPDLLPAMATSEAYAKVRAGGISAADIPSTAAIFDFLQSAIGTRVPFKATAGLHHPLRSERPLTHERGAPSVVMHGFVNVFVAAVVLYNRINDDDAVSILNETDAAAFTFDNDELRWRDRVTLAGERIAEARHLALSFGSCSFGEPVADLQGLGWL